jgi:hypothetical protein
VTDRTSGLEADSYGCFGCFRYGSILLADGRSLKDLCKELADQNKLGESTKRVAWAGETNSCIDCGDRGNLSQCQGCDLAWCHDCAEETSDLGQKLFKPSRKPNSFKIRNLLSNVLNGSLERSKAK